MKTTVEQVRWREIEKLFDAAVACSGPDRERVLFGGCGSDPPLRAEVESLLAAHDRASSILDAPAFDIAPRGRHEFTPTITEGQRIGRYALRSVIGRGGMGVVYEAQQDNPSRVVALKVMRALPLLDELTPRLFQREGQALARLGHPGIAAIHEAGRGEDGCYYFAMERVEGTPLTDYARQRKLPLRERLELFRRVCDAVHYAHQRGVIHRDLKPNNILVTPAGQPKVLDFGLARITDPDVQHTRLTEPGGFQGTLAYASPEQARGSSDDVDLRSDLYSLGVVLYELLTDRRPYEIAGLPLPEAARVVCERMPQPAGSIDRALRGDLETIIAKALEKDPQRRYASAAALGEDIERYLNHQPILARPPGAWYQVRKFARRHTLPVLLAAMVLLVVMSAAVVTAYQAVQLARQRDAAVVARNSEAEARAGAEQVSAFLEQLFEHANPEASSTKEPTVRDLLEAGGEKLESELADQPLVRARLATVMGDVYARLNDFPKSRSLLETAVEIRRQELGPTHPDLAESLQKLASACTRSGDDDGAHKRGLESLQICEKHFGVPHERVVAALEELGSARFYAGDNATALEYIQRSLDMSRELFAEESEQVARDLVNLGHVLQREKRLDEAGEAFQSALDIRRRLLGDHDLVGLALNGLAKFEFARGNPQAAEKYVAEEVEMYRRIFHEKHPRLAWGLNNLAFYVAHNRGPEAGEPLYREALAIRRSAFGERHTEIADSLNDLAVVLADQGKFDEAIELHHEALEMRRSLVGNEHSVVAASLQGLGETLHRAGRLDEAEPVLLDANASFVRLRGESHDLTRINVRSLAQLYEAMDRADEASLWRAKLPPDPK